MWSGDNDLDASPFRVLNGGTSTSPTAVALTAVIPATARLAYVRLINLANAVVFFGPTSNVNGPALNAGNTAAQTAFSFIPMDSSQQYYYDYNVAPTGGAYIDVYGYHFDR
jgi:hypothetical protein